MQLTTIVPAAAPTVASLVPPPLAKLLPGSLRVGPFLVGSDGSLLPGPDAVPAFAFRVRGRRVEGRLAPDGVARFAAMLGRPPFTAEDAPARAALLGSLATLRRSLGPVGRIELRPNLALMLESRHRLPTPVCASTLLAAATGYAIGLGLVLDALDEAGLRLA